MLNDKKNCLFACDIRKSAILTYWYICFNRASISEILTWHFALFSASIQVWVLMKIVFHYMKKGSSTWNEIRIKERPVVYFIKIVWFRSLHNIYLQNNSQGWFYFRFIEPSIYFQPSIQKGYVYFLLYLNYHNFLNNF